MKRSGSVLGGIGLSSLVVACAAQPPPPPAPAPVVVQEAPPPPPPSRWVPVAVPPSMGEGWKVLTSEGLVSSDLSGGRWLFPPEGATPRSVASLDLEPFVSREAIPEGGILATTKDGRLLLAKTALAPFEPLGRLPEKADKKSFVRFDGVLTVRDERGLVTSTDGTSYRPVASLPGFDPVAAVFDAAGHGVGLFAPETVAHTTDRGATWRVVPTPGVSARAIEIYGGKATLRPGGERDGFAREVDFRTGALARIHVVNDSAEIDRFRQGPGGDRVRPTLPVGKGDPPLPAKPVRWSPRGSGYAAGVSMASDGDKLVVFPNAGSRKKAWKQPILVGKIGEGLVPFGGGELDSCTPLAAAVCDDIVAVSCQDRLEVFRGDTSIARFPLESRSALGFDGKGRLLGITRGKQGERKLRVYDPSDLAKVDERALPTDDGPTETLHGGCKRPALWSTTGKHAQRWEGEAFGEPLEQPEKTIVVGIDHQRDLVLAKVTPMMVLGVGTTPVGNELTYLSAGQTIETRQAQDGGLTLAEDGRHGLLVTIDRQVLQTDDGGRTFSPIAAPQTNPGQAVFCGRDRCQLGAGAYREGFVRDPAFVPSAEPPPKPLTPPVLKVKGAPPTKPAPKPAEQLPVVMRCAIDRSVLTGAPELSDGIAPRVGSTFFVGAESEADLRGIKQQTIFGEASGKAIVENLAAVRPRSRGLEAIPPELMVGGGPGIIERDPGRYDDRADTSYRWAPGAAVVRFKEDPRWQSVFQEVGLFGEDVLGAASTGALMVWGKHKPRIVPFPRTAGGVGAGVILEAADGAIHTAFELSPTEGRLVFVGADEAVREREFLIRRPGGRESGLGLIAGTTPSLVLVETTEDGGAELRVRSLGPDLSFGPPTAVPGTRAAPGELIPLATCAPGAKGAIVRLLTDKRVAVRVGEIDQPGFVQRLARVTESSACAERTFFANAPIGLDSVAVVAGNGGLGAHVGVKGASEPGLKCEPLDTKALPPPKKPSLEQP